MKKDCAPFVNFKKEKEAHMTLFLLIKFDVLLRAMSATFSTNSSTDSIM